MILFDINNYIQTDTALVTLSGKDSLILEPAMGYGDEVAPVLVYWYHPGIVTRDIEGWRRDVVRYMIMDTDAERCLKMGERFVALLNKGSDIRTAVNSSDNVMKYSFLTRGTFEGPAIRQGWYRYTIDFQISWTPDDS